MIKHAAIVPYEIKSRGRSETFCEFHRSFALLSDSSFGLADLVIEP
jgi:hypothetical protein